MSIIEQIKAMETGATGENAAWYFWDNGQARHLPIADLIALAESHERLLAAAKTANEAMTLDAAMCDGSFESSQSELEAAIEEAEKI